MAISAQLAGLAHAAIGEGVLPSAAADLDAAIDRVVEDVDAEGRAFQKAAAATVRRIVNMTALTVCRNQLCAPMPDPISHSRSR